MKKLICLLLLMLFLTGCDATYNLTINKATIAEDLQIYEEDINKWNQEVEIFATSYKNVIQNNLGYKLGIFIDEQLADAEKDNPNYIFYKPTKIQEKTRLGIAYKYRFNIEDYDRAYFPRNCFDKIKVYKENGYITISTSKGFNCMDDDLGLSSLTINITTKYSVDSNNSDFTEGNTYSWVIHKNNYDDKNIYIKVNTNELSQIKNKDKEKKTVKLFLIAGISLAILLIIVIIFLLNKKKMLEKN